MRKKLLLTASLLILIFIFSQSCMSGDDSSAESGRMLMLILQITNKLPLPFEITEYMIRKLAHFTEFGVFGFFTSWTMYEYTNQIKTQIFKLLFILLSVPVIDETLQYFSPERTPQVKDILIDFSGSICGSMLIILIIFILAKKNKKQIQ